MLTFLRTRQKPQSARALASKRYRKVGQKLYLKSEKVERTRQKLKLRGLVTDLWVFSTFFATLNVLVLGIRDKNVFFSTEMVENTFIKPRIDGIDLMSVDSFGKLVQYLNDTLLVNLHLPRERNLELAVSDEGWISGYTAKLLSVASLRQIRVADEECPRKSLAHSKLCQPPFRNNRDRKSYFPKWRLDSEGNFSRRLLGPWRYSEDFSPPLFAKDHLHFGGGYVAHLGRSFNASRSTLDFLLANNWLDSHTRVLFVEFCLYNADADVFNVVHLIFESNAVGRVFPHFYIQTVKLLFNFSAMSGFFISMFVLFVLLTFGFLLKILLKLVQMRLKEYFSCVWNVIDLLIVVLSYGLIWLFIERNAYVDRLLLRLKKTNNREFVSFAAAATFDNLVATMTSILICVATIRLWKILQIFPVFSLFTKTLSKSRKPLLSCLILVAIFFIGHGGCTFLVNGDHSEILHNLQSVIPALLAVAFGFEPFEVENFMFGGEIFGELLVVLMLVAVTIYLLNMMITVLIFYFKKTKNEERQRQKSYTIGDFIHEKLGKWWPRVESSEDDLEKPEPLEISAKRWKNFRKCLEAQLKALEELRKSRKENDGKIEKMLTLQAESFTMNIRVSVQNK